MGCHYVVSLWNLEKDKIQVFCCFVLILLYMMYLFVLVHV